jgi:NADH-quinone oxidoreductase subunit E
MKRYDLRHLHDDFYDRMAELIDQGLKTGEVGIFLFEVGDFSHIQKSADFIRALGHDLMNSLKFNEVDWTIVVKKVDEATRKARAEEIEAARIEAEKKAAEEAAAAEAKAKEQAEAEAKAKAAAEAESAKEKKKAAPAKNSPAKKPASKKPARKSKAK